MSQYSQTGVIIKICRLYLFMKCFSQVILIGSLMQFKSVTALMHQLDLHEEVYIYF